MQYVHLKKHYKHSYIRGINEKPKKGGKKETVKVLKLNSSMSD